MKRLGFGLCGLSLAVMLAVRCYSPDLSGVHYTCDETNPYCPDGLECIEGACLPPGSTPTSDGGSLPDGTMAVMGCASGQGFAVGNAFACPGQFNTADDAIPKASALCATGYKLCTDAGMVDQNACKMLKGFFAGQVNLKRSGNGQNNQPLQCGYQMFNPFFGGCGVSRTNIIGLTGTQVCSGFGQAVDCVSEQAWQCNSNNLDGSINTNAGDGVLCCKMP